MAGCLALQDGLRKARNYLEWTESPGRFLGWIMAVQACKHPEASAAAPKPTDCPPALFRVLHLVDWRKLPCECGLRAPFVRRAPRKARSITHKHREQTHGACQPNFLDEVAHLRSVFLPQ